MEKRANLTSLNLIEASELVRTKRVSPVELTQECLDRIEAFDPKLNSFITVTAELALTQAREAESQIQRGDWKGPLHGIPIAIKDIVDTADVITTGASAILKDRTPGKDAEVVRRLKAAGGVILGKLNLHEFAYGGSSAVSYFGAVCNPWNAMYSSGGSSGGSAAAVAAQLCFGSIGTDTGGSIRQPASYCGVVGLKPSYGRVSTTGVIPLSWSLDHVGPLTRTVKDAAALLQILASYDPNDLASMETPVPDYTATIVTSNSDLRLGIPRAYFYDDLHPEIEAAMKEALCVLRGLTKSQEEIAPLANDATYSGWTNSYSTVFNAEAYAYHKDYIEKNPERYQPATLNRLRVGAEVTAAKYIVSRRHLESVRRSVASVFRDVDLLVTPTVRIPPFTIAELQSDPDAIRHKELAMLHNTRLWNFVGLPTISLPCGFTRNGLPIGLQITGRPGDEATVCRLAHAYEQATDWHQREPKLTN